MEHVREEHVVRAVTLDPIALACELPDAQSFEQAVLAGFGVELGFDAAFFLAKGDVPTAVALDPRQLSTALSDGRYDEETLPLKAAALRARGVVVDTDVLGERRVRAMRYHRELAAPIGGRHSLVAYLQARGQLFGLMMLGRTGRTFNERETAAVRALCPSLAIARASFGAACSDEPLPEHAVTLADNFSRMLTGSVVRAQVRRDGQRVLVRDVGHEREMVAQRGPLELVWTRVDRREPRRSAWFYVELFQLALARARHRKRALFIGAGGGAAVHQFRSLQPALQIDVVELDADVLQLANTWFGLASVPNVRTIVGDGAAHLADAAAATWDVIVVDAYGAGHELPSSFSDPAFWSNAALRLRAGGALAINVIGTLDGRGPVAQLERTVAQHFEHVRLVPVVDPGEKLDATAARNVVLLASQR
jgi:spermidine synthase